VVVDYIDKACRRKKREGKKWW